MPCLHRPFAHGAGRLSRCSVLPRRGLCSSGVTHRPSLGLDLELSNKSSILPLVNRALGRSRPPAVEFLVAAAVRGSAQVPWPRRLLGNPCGHALVAYRLPGQQKGRPEQQVVMNIVNPGHASNPSSVHIVNFLSLEEMLFGIGDTDGACGSEQGGVYNRAFTGLRIEELPDADILAMHHAFLSLAQQGAAGRLSFSITGGQVRGLAQQFLSLGNRSVGNCAIWTAGGLVAAGLIRRPSVFPGRIWSMMHEGALTRFCKSNVNVVHYAEVPGCFKQHPRLECAEGELASLSGPLATWRYWRRERFAHVTVSTAKGDHAATVSKAVATPPTPTLPMRGFVAGVPGPRFLGLGASVVGLACVGWTGCAAALAFVVTVLH